MISLLLSLILAADDQPFGIRVVDEATGRGVPLVQLKTVNHLEFFTDSNGLAAIDEPSFYGQEVFFHVQSHGYEFPKDGFGYRGKRLRVEPGKIETIQLTRNNVAERLYRVTGGGIYRDSVLLGQPVPTQRPVINARVLGSDSVQAAKFRGMLFWFWGDTSRPAYPLGNFHVPGAVSRLPGDGGLDPAKGVDLEYFVEEEGAFAKETAKLPGSGPTWIDGLVTVKDDDGAERLFAAYVKIRPPMTAYRRGLVEFDPQANRFQAIVEFPLEAPFHPGGHTFLHTERDTQYVYFTQPYPLLRVPATPAAVKDLNQYEAFTCLREGSTLKEPVIDRDSEGRVRYGWKRNTAFVGPADEQQLVKKGLLFESERLLQLQDVETGEPVLAHSGSVCWNAFRNRWVMITGQLYGSSMLGEVWYAEADTPTGPWVYARKVVTHEKYSFYNPTQHPFFDQQSGRVIYFEGTYASTFSGNDDPTPRYDYNQIMYRLDLQDDRLTLPIAFYENQTPGPPFVSYDPSQPAGPVRFFALDRPRPGTVGFVWSETDAGLKLRAAMPDKTAAFYALPIDSKDKESTKNLVTLYEYKAKSTGTWHYTTDANLPVDQSEQRTPVCLVWRR